MSDKFTQTPAKNRQELKHVRFAGKSLEHGEKTARTSTGARAQPGFSPKKTRTSERRTG